MGKKYEYKIVKIPTGLKCLFEVIKTLNEEGENGWRLVPSSIFSDLSNLLLEREIPEP
ncbi:DUF4177 domain-containing protein [Patescibacteria group bacterium]|nr:DUF4177 domain-containing protein [Patescibacteria group bacterium]